MQFGKLVLYPLSLSLCLLLENISWIEDCDLQFCMSWFLKRLFHILCEFLNHVFNSRDLRFAALMCEKILDHLHSWLAAWCSLGFANNEVLMEYLFIDSIDGNFVHFHWMLSNVAEFWSIMGQFYYIN